jgi:hypothetical protein
MKNHAAMMSSADETWNTPALVLDALRAGFGEIGLDPCDNSSSLTMARKSCRKDRGEDGLACSWQESGLVFVNPPYGREISKWAKKAAIEAGKGAEIVSLVPARVDTSWFETLTTNAAAVLFWRGRLRFGNATSGAPFPSALVYHGARYDLFIDTFRARGSLWVPLA